MEAQTDLIRAFGGTTTAMGATLGGVGVAVQTFPVAALAPVFGVVGAHFLGAFAAATAKQAVSIGMLGASVLESGAATMASANAYDTTDSNVQGLLGAAAAGLDG